MYTNTRSTILGLSIDNVTLSEAVDNIIASVRSGAYSYAVTPNVDHVMKLRHDPRLREAYDGARFVFADGVPLLWAATLLRQPLRERVNGTDLFERLCERSAAERLRVFLLGGSPGAAEGAARELRRRHPELAIAGWECPEFGFHTDKARCLELQRRIAASNADVLFVGLGAPKQEEWICHYGEGTGVRFAIGIGVSFSFVGGEIPRAPQWMQKCGLEWFRRLISEPTRLWRRYLVDDIGFLPMVLHEVLMQSMRRLNRSQNRTPALRESGGQIRSAPLARNVKAPRHQLGEE
ncbi:MAG: WecB/TagA/CpsF family glycosyltransferase [Acidobacteriaceae bacterium]